MTEFIVSSEAETDLVEAFNFYDNKVAGLGREFVRSVDAEYCPNTETALGVPPKRSPPQVGHDRAFSLYDLLHL